MGVSILHDYHLGCMAGVEAQLRLPLIGQRWHMTQLLLCILHLCHGGSYLMKTLFKVPVKDRLLIKV